MRTAIEATTRTLETSAWWNTLKHFDGINIGLTATLAAHTLSLFKEVVYRYMTEQVIVSLDKGKTIIFVCLNVIYKQLQ